MLLSNEQVRAFESPTRAAILTILRAHRVLSAKELSEILGMKPDALYYHLKKLQALGLVQVKEHRAGETRPAAIYELTAPEFYMKDSVDADAEYRDSLNRAAQSLLRQALRRYKSSLESGSPDPLRFSFASARLSPESIERFKSELRELLRRILATNDPDGEPVLFASLLVPAKPAPDEVLT